MSDIAHLQRMNVGSGLRVSPASGRDGQTARPLPWRRIACMGTVHGFAPGSGASQPACLRYSVTTTLCRLPSSGSVTHPSLHGNAAPSRFAPETPSPRAEALSTRIE